MQQGTGTGLIDTNDLDKVLELTATIKKLEKEKGQYTTKIKNAMVSSGKSEIIHNGSKIQVITSTRNTVKKNMKDAFLLFLSNKGLKGCVSIEYDINKETLKTEIAAGNISESEVQQYMTSTEVLTMRITL